MNKPRRKRLQEALDLLSLAQDIIMEVQEEEQEAFDNMPESLQHSSRGEQMEGYIDTLDTNYQNISDVIDWLMEIVEG